MFLKYNSPALCEVCEDKVWVETFEKVFWPIVSKPLPWHNLQFVLDRDQYVHSLYFLSQKKKRKQKSDREIFEPGKETVWEIKLKTLHI